MSLQVGCRCANSNDLKLTQSASHLLPSQYPSDLLVYKCNPCSSPHLLEVRERIRLNGVPLSKAEFVSYFWDCYNKLAESEVGLQKRHGNC